MKKSPLAAYGRSGMFSKRPMTPDMGGEAVPVEIEANERVYTKNPDGSYELYGSTPPDAPKHEQGGVKLELPEGALVFPKNYYRQLDQAMKYGGETGDWSKMEKVEKIMKHNANKAYESGKPYSSGGKQAAYGTEVEEGIVPGKGPQTIMAKGSKQPFKLDFGLGNTLQQSGFETRGFSTGNNGMGILGLNQTIPLGDKMRLNVGNTSVMDLNNPNAGGLFNPNASLDMTTKHGTFSLGGSKEGINLGFKKTFKGGGKVCGCGGKMRNGGSCMKCGGEAKMSDGGEVLKYEDGGEVTSPKGQKKRGLETWMVKNDLERLKTVREKGVSAQEGQAINKEINENYGENSKIAYLANTAIHEGFHKNASEGYDMEDSGTLAGSGVKFSSAILREYAGFEEGVDYLTGKKDKLSPSYLGSLTNSLTSATGSYDDAGGESGGSSAKTKTSSPLSYQLPKGKNTEWNKGIVSGQQEILNKLIASDTSNNKPSLLTEDDIMGPMTRAAMDYYEGKGYKTPTLLSAENVAQYKKNWANMSALEKQKAIISKNASETGTEEPKLQLNQKMVPVPKFSGLPGQPTSTSSWMDDYINKPMMTPNMGGAYSMQQKQMAKEMPVYNFDNDMEFETNRYNTTKASPMATPSAGPGSAQGEYNDGYIQVKNGRTMLLDNEGTEVTELRPNDMRGSEVYVPGKGLYKFLNKNAALKSTGSLQTTTKSPFSGGRGLPGTLPESTSTTQTEQQMPTTIPTTAKSPFSGGRGLPGTLPESTSTTQAPLPIPSYFNSNAAKLSARKAFPATPGQAPVTEIQKEVPYLDQTEMSTKVEDYLNEKDTESYKVAIGRKTTANEISEFLEKNINYIHTAIRNNGNPAAANDGSTDYKFFIEKYQEAIGKMKKAGHTQNIEQKALHYLANSAIGQKKRLPFKKVNQDLENLKWKGYVNKNKALSYGFGGRIPKLSKLK